MSMIIAQTHLPGNNYTGPVGDPDRIFKYKSKFEKGYVGFWTNEIFIVDKVNSTSPPTYELIGQDKEQIIDTKKPYSTAWINKAKPYFVEQIGDTLQGDLDMNNFTITNLKLPENDYDAVHKKYLMDQLNLIEVNKDHLKERIGDVKRYFKRQIIIKLLTKLQQEVTSLKSFIEEQLLNVVDKTQLQTLSSLISNLDDKITKQKVDLKQLIANINPSLSED
ncbi:hypothetical protein LOTGIDRAFT_171344 [Lottia gigantea]|uniref:Uncharacterized protein n=1 Tax=Lottia gigantea TaxID=225164 RepID=V4CMH7_LOTGI|nr:hypothetical protein LOTGIDRAFT_171344 [Lottia gigantea]ESP03550.1 hypothetical protein LOTGIDRAFT_171344 [Lottia gigantea]